MIDEITERFSDGIFKTAMAAVAAAVPCAPITFDKGGEKLLQNSAKIIQSY